MEKRGFWGLFGLLTVTLAADPSAGSVVAGWGGISVPGALTPLTVTPPAGEGPWSIRGEGLAADLPPGGSASLACLVPAGAQRLTFQFFSAGRLRDEAVVDLSAGLFPGHLIATWGVSPPVRARLAGLLWPGEPVRVAEEAPEHWPATALGWTSLAALVVQDPGPVLAPAQARALGAWLASGGRLVLLGRPPGASLAGQLPPSRGLGIVVRTADPEAPGWEASLALRPFGDEPRWGAEVPEAPSGGNTGLRPVGSWPLVALASWLVPAAAGLWRARGRRAGPVAAASAAGVLLVLLLAWTGALDRDQGLRQRVRDLVLPGDAGTFRYRESHRTEGKAAGVGWPEASPWARERRSGAGLRVVDDPGRSVELTFAPGPAEQPRFRFRPAPGGAFWEEAGPEGWVHRESAPPDLVPDLPWIQTLLKTYPKLAWTGGTGADRVWLRPEAAP